MVRVLAFVGGVAAGVALLLFVVAGLSLSAPAPMRAQAMTLDVQQDSGATFAHPSDLESTPSITGEEDPDDGTQLDLQGDQVTPAVATYKFDAQGNIYETHAPHTEVPKLGSPTL